MERIRNIFRCLLPLLFCAAAFAQTETGQVSGTVHDPTGAVVPNTTVNITSVDKGNTLTTTTNTRGEYRFSNLQPGTYEVGVNVQGFAPFKRRVEVTVGSANTVDAAMTVAGAGTTVEVTAEGGVQPDTTTQTISQVVNATQITQLPTITRNPYDLVGTSGNVAQDPTALAGGARGVGFNINGQRAASTNILLDGGENRDEFTATTGTNIPLDSVQEFRVLTSNYTAEYGRATGGVVNVATRSGTNSLHGSVYEFNRNSFLAANSPENKATGLPRDQFNRNQFGYSIGGPIIKDKLFFFDSTEWTRVRSNLATQAVVPTPAFIATTSPLTQAYFNALGRLRPDVTVQQVLGNVEQISFPTAANAGGGDPQNTYFGVIRVDFNLTQRTQLFARYAGDHEKFFPGTVSTSPYLGFETGQNALNQNAMLNVTHTFGSGFISQSKVAFNRLNLVQPLGPAGTVPGLFATSAGFTLSSTGTPMFLPGYLPLAPGSALPFGGPQNLYQFFQEFAFTRGAHNFKFGGQYIHTRDNRTFGAFETGFETLSRTGNLTSILTALQQGTLRQFQGAIDPRGAFPCPVNQTTGAPIVSAACSVSLPVTPPLFNRNNRYNDAAAYVQDSWKIFPRFTLNMGLRWEYFGPQHNANPNLDSNFYLGPGANFVQQIANGQVLLAPNSPVGGLWSPDYKDFGPRVGFAWDLFGNGKSSLRGGYGISYERNFGNVTFNVIQNPPNYAVLSLTSGTDVPATGPGSLQITTSNAGPLAGSTPPTKALPATSLRGVDPNIKTAYAHMYSMAFEQEIVPNTVLGIEYSGSRGIHQYGIANINRPGYGDIFLSTPPSSTGFLARLNPQYTNINFRNSVGDSYYNGLNVRVQSANFRQYGITLTANYTWSHAIDDLSTTFSETPFNALNLGYLDPFNPGLDRGNADYDVRHRAVISAVWELPWLKNRGVLSQIVGGWSFAPIFSVSTGLPFTMFDCTNAQSVCPRYIPGTPGALPTVGDADASTATGPNTFTYLTLPTPANYNNPFLAGVAGSFSDIGVCGPGSLPNQCVFPANMTRRNSFRGPNTWNQDLGVYKNFKVTERVGLQFRGELFNLFNHPNLFVVPGTTDVSSSPVVQAKKGGLGISPSFDARQRRNVQLAVKVNF